MDDELIRDMNLHDMRRLSEEQEVLNAELSKAGLESLDGENPNRSTRRRRTLDFQSIEPNENKCHVVNYYSFP